MYHLVSMYSFLTLAVYPQYSKNVLGTVLAKNKVKIIVNIPWFPVKNDVSGNLRSWDIIIVSHVEWTLAYFYSCHINEALKTTLSALFDFSNSIYSGLFSSQSYKCRVICSSSCRYCSSVSNWIFDWLKINKEKPSVNILAKSDPATLVIFYFEQVFIYCICSH